MAKLSIILFFYIYIMEFNIYSQDLNYAVLSRKNIIYPLGYLRVDSLFNKPFLIGGGINFAFENKQIYSSGLKFKVASLLFERKSWKTVGNIGMDTHLQNNTSFRSTDFSSSIFLISGFFKPKWFCSASITTGIPIISQIEFNIDKDEINRFYGNYPEKGWYNPKGISYYYGFSLGCTIKERSDIVIGYSQLIHKVKNFKGYIIPYSFGSLSLGLNYRFGKKIETKK